ncbi:MAG: aminopeptidase P family protein [Pyrinomonadaceae bacterium]|nr:aminopeptidase P family protein [Pyrinomonadaceae bacterium]MBP6212582.1 aminopeptidase P family protein [Pyrinomonadaceae bacterium]
MNIELKEKTERLVDMLGREGLDAVLLNAQHNFSWLTGGSSNGVDLSRENGVASLLVTRDGKRFLLANNIEVQRMLDDEVNAEDFEPVSFSWQDEKADPGLVIEMARSVLEPFGAVASDVTIDASIASIEGKIAACRHRLTADELIRIRTLGTDAGEALRRAIDRLKPGDLETEIAEKMRHELAGVGLHSVVTLVAADERISKFRHPVPTTNRWQKTLLIVTCARRRGLIVSLSRMISIGEASDDLKRRTVAAACVNAALYAATRPGATGAELYHAAANAYAEQGFAGEINLHHQGGAAGYKTREWVAHPASNEVVKPDQAFAWNPSITGTKVEETCIVNDSGVEVITASPDFPKIETVIDGRHYYSPGILSL